MKEELKLAVCQLRTELDREATMKKASDMIAAAARNSCDIAVLPEMFNCPYSRKWFLTFSETDTKKCLETMSAWAAKNGILLIGGSIPEKTGDKLYNTCFVFDGSGELIARHRKVHLFDVDIPGMRFAESDSFTPGSEITVFDTPFGIMGAAVCFDVRFPELFRAMAVRGAQVIFLPAQFNMATGPAHWAETLKIRAVDNEVFVVGASAARYTGFKYECWGHSVVYDPFGVCLASADETEQILYADIDLKRVDEVRSQLPTFRRLRRDVYTVSE